MATGFTPAFAQSSERVAHINERLAVSKMVAATRARAGAKWFYWIAGLSMVNSIVAFTGGNFHFVVGLGITAFVDGVAKRLASAGAVLDLIINGFFAGVLIVFGSFAIKMQRWAFILGMTLYAFDGLLLLRVRDYLAVGFHVFALYAIYSGYKASKSVQI